MQCLRWIVWERGVAAVSRLMGGARVAVEQRVECQRDRSRYQTLVDDHGSPASARPTGVRVRVRTPGLHLP